MPSSKCLVGRFAEGKHHGSFRHHRDPGGGVAHLFRLVGAVLLLFCGSAWATISPSPVTTYQLQSSYAYMGVTGKASLVDACTAAAAYLTANSTQYSYFYNSSTTNGQTGSNYVGTCKDDIKTKAGAVVATNSPEPYQVLQSTSNVCPVNSTGTTSCTCNAGFVESGGQCVDPDTAACAGLSGQSAGMKNWEGKADSFSFCDAYATSGGTTVGGGKCVATAWKGISWESPPGSGHWISQGAATYTGGKATSCTGTGGTGSDPAGSTPPGSDGTPPKEPGTGQAAPSPCPMGQAPGEVNGQRVCAPIGDDTPKEARDQGTTKNPDGSTTATDSTTKCKDGKCETTGTSCTTPAGGGTPVCTPTGGTMSQGAFCAQNKGSNVCIGQGDGEGGSFTGDCVAGFKAVSEDPVIAAMALEQHKRNCELLKKDSPESQAYDALKDVGGTTKATNPNDSSVTIGAGSFDSSDAIGGGGCNLNKTIVVAGRSVVLPINDYLCNPLAIMGQLLVAVSLLLAARIVTRG